MRPGKKLFFEPYLNLNQYNAHDQCNQRQSIWNNQEEAKKRKLHSEEDRVSGGNRLAQSCSTHQEKLIVLTLLDTGLRVSLAELTKENVDWQMHRLMIYGKSGPYGTKSSATSSPVPRVQPL